MIRYQLGAGAAGVRWAMSPIHEVVSLARLLTEPQRHRVYEPWLRRRRHRLKDVDLSALTVFMSDGAYRPDFLDPPPPHPEPTFEEGVEALLATPTDQVHAELVDAFRGRSGEAAERLTGSPERTKVEAAGAIMRLWRAAVEPEWPSMRQALRAELLDRALQTSREGLRSVVGRLHPSVEYRESTLTVDTCVDVDSACPDGLVLIPSLFITDRVQCSTSDHWGPAICYPAPGRYLWSRPVPPASLEQLLGRTRSKILAAIAVTPLQTSVVAALVDVTAPTASEHLAVLRNAGLIDTSRSGRTAIHELSASGRVLLGGGPGRGTVKAD